MTRLYAIACVVNGAVAAYWAVVAWQDEHGVAWALLAIYVALTMLNLIRLIQLRR